MARDFNAIMGYRFEELHVGMTAEEVWAGRG